MKDGYKVSGFGEIPQEWEVRAMGEIFTRVVRKNIENNANNMTISAKYGLVSQEEYFKKTVASDNNSKYYLMHKGEFAYNKSYSNDYPVGAIKRLDRYDKGVVSTLYICFSINCGYDSDYFQQYFESDLIHKEIGKIAQEGARNHGLLNIGVSEFFDEVNVLVPPLPEQKKIAKILSTVDGHIDEVDGMIEDLKELKKGLMQKLLTEGIGHTEFKDSEVGRIPVEWAVKTFESICVDKGLVRGPFGGALKKEFFVEDGYKVYEQKNAISKSADIGDYYVDYDKYKELERFAVDEGDFIVSCSGTIGRIFQIPPNHKPGVINQALLKVTLNTNMINDDFFYQYFEYEKFQNRIIDSTQGGAMKNLVGMPIIKKTMFPLPPIDEQQRIADILGNIDERIVIVNQEKDDLNELKKGLMQQLLTGKVRVLI